MNRSSPWHPESGQALLIAVFIGLLLLIAIPVVVLVNTTGIFQHVAVANRDKAAAIAEGGIQYAVQEFTKGDWTTWNNALGGTFPADCLPSADRITGADGGQFKLTCSNGNGAQPFEVGVLATAYVPETGHPGILVPTRAIQAYLSPRSAAVSLPNGYTASAALRLANLPNIIPGGNFDVNLGPIVVSSVAIWAVSDYTDGSNSALVAGTPLFNVVSQMDTKRYPRKFTPGGITEFGSIPGALLYRSPYSNTPPFTDQREYWAWTSIGFSAPINTANYIAMAQNSRCTTAPTGCAPLTNCNGVPLGSCYFQNVSGDTATFNGSFAAPTGAPPVIYVDGNAHIKNLNLDLRPAGAIIVTGNLVLDDSNVGASAAVLHVPITAPLEYSYWPGFLYHNYVGKDIAGESTRLGGFIYVGKNLEVMPVSTNPKYWKMLGVLMVDGQLTVDLNAGLSLWYDDNVNHKIQMGVFSVMIDSQTERTAQ